MQSNGPGTKPKLDWENRSEMLLDCRVSDPVDWDA